MRMNFQKFPWSVFKSSELANKLIFRTAKSRASLKFDRICMYSITIHGKSRDKHDVGLFP